MHGYKQHKISDINDHTCFLKICYNQPKQIKKDRRRWQGTGSKIKGYGQGVHRGAEAPLLLQGHCSYSPTIEAIGKC